MVKKLRFLNKDVSLLYNQLSTKVRVQKARGRQKFNPAIFNLPEAISVKINAIRLLIVQIYREEAGGELSNDYSPAVVKSNI